MTIVYTDRLDVDKVYNTAERALRTVVLGHKSWLFADSGDGCEGAAAIYSLIGTAELNGFNPERYLQHVLQRIANHPIDKIEGLLPSNFLAQEPSLRMAA